MPPLEPPTRLDREPPVLWGCTAPELVALLALGLLGWGPLVLGLASSAGYGFTTLPIVGLLTFVTVRLGAAQLRRVKRGRPEHEFQHRLLLLTMRWGLRRTTFIRASGPWSLGRSRHGLS